MTIQEYIELSQSSVSNFFDNFVPTLTNIIAAIIAVAVGVIVGWVLKRVVEEVSKAVSLERALSGLPFYSAVVKSHENTDVTTLIGEAVRWIAIVVFLVAAVGSLQIGGADVVFSQVFGYITSVIIAALYLLFGFVIAWFIHRVIASVGMIVGTNPAHIIANVAYVAILVFAGLKSLSALGVTVEVVRLLIIAALAAGALAFGLAGKDAAADLVKRFMDRAK